MISILYFIYTTTPFFGLNWFLQNKLWTEENFSVREFYHVFGETILFTHKTFWIIVFLVTFRYVLQKCSEYLICRPRYTKLSTFLDFIYKMTKYLLWISVGIIGLGVFMTFLFAKYGFSYELVSSFDLALKSLRKSGLYLNIWLVGTTPGVLFVFYIFVCGVVALFFYKIWAIDKPLVAAHKEKRIQVSLIILVVNLFILGNARKEFLSILVEEFSSMKKGESMFFLFNRYEIIANIIFYSFTALVFSAVALWFINKKKLWKYTPTNKYVSAAFVKDITEYLAKSIRIVAIFNISMAIFYLRYQYIFSSSIENALLS